MDEVIRPKRIKIGPNLYKVGDIYRYRRGDDERVLGRFKTDKQAMKARDAHESLRSTVGPESFRARLKHAWDPYFEYRQDQAAGRIKGRKRLSTATLTEIDRIWNNHLLRFFGNKHFAEVDDPLWERYCELATVSDLKNHRKVLGGFLRWCKKKGMTRVLPEFDVPHVETRKRPILTRDQITALLTNAEGKVLLFVAMYLFMGMRRSEQMHLKWSSVNMVDRSIYVHDETTRTRKGRAIPINSFVLALLIKLKGLQKEAGINTPFVYPRRGQPMRHMRADGISKTWHRLLKRAQLTNIEPHDLRATYEYYANKSVEHTDMQREKMAGASIKVQSQRYVTFDAEDLRGLEEVVNFEGLANTLKLTEFPTTSRKTHGKKTGMANKRNASKTGKADE